MRLQRGQVARLSRSRADACHCGDLLPAAPCLKGEQHIAADHQCPLGLRLCCRQIAQGLHRIAFPAAARFISRNSEPRIFFRGKAAHRKPVLRSHIGGRGFVRRFPGRHERHAVQGECVMHRLRQMQMPQMDRIEAAAEEPAASHFTRFFVPTSSITGFFGCGL